jgi:hypothetical protein
MHFMGYVYGGWMVSTLPHPEKLLLTALENYLKASYLAYLDKNNIAVFLNFLLWANLTH